MATTAPSRALFYAPSSLTPKPSHSPSTTRTFTPNPRTRIPTIRATAPDIIGDFGARDPFPAELESNFGEKVLGNVSTEHKILIPEATALSLAQQSCVPISPGATSLSQYEAKQLLFKVVGWRLVEDKDNDGKTVLKLQCLWKLRDFDAGVELTRRLSEVAEGAGHSVVLQHLEETNQVRAELWTQEIGGLSVNDFIVAAKIDEVKTSDLVPKKRMWA